MAALGGQGADFIEGLRRLDRETAGRLASRHLERLRALNRTALRIVDKMPDNYLYLGLLASLFPRAKLIHCRRDLRDVAVSCWMTHFQEIRWANDQQHIASRFHEYQRMMEHWRKVLPVPLLEVDYEETVADLEGVARRLVAWCGLAWEPTCLEFHQAKRPVRTASAVQVRQPVFRTSVGRWKHYEHALASLPTGRGGCSRPQGSVAPVSWRQSDTVVIDHLIWLDEPRVEIFGAAAWGRFLGERLQGVGRSDSTKEADKQSRATGGGVRGGKGAGQGKRFANLTRAGHSVGKTWHRIAGRMSRGRAEVSPSHGSSYPKQESYEVVPHVWIRAGGRPQGALCLRQYAWERWGTWLVYARFR